MLAAVSVEQGLSQKEVSIETICQANKALGLRRALSQKLDHLTRPSVQPKKAATGPTDRESKKTF